MPAIGTFDEAADHTLWINRRPFDRRAAKFADMHSNQLLFVAVVHVIYLLSSAMRLLTGQTRRFVTLSGNDAFVLKAGCISLDIDRTDVHLGLSRPGELLPAAFTTS